MTVQDLINQLNQIKDKSQKVVIEFIGNHKIYDVNEIVSANIPKNNSCEDYVRGIVISNA